MKPAFTIKKNVFLPVFQFKKPLFAFALTILFGISVYPQDKSAVQDDFQKVILFTFQNISPVQEEMINGKKSSAEEKIDYLSDIIPLNLKREIESNNRYAASIEKLQLSQAAAESDVKKILKEKTQEKNVQFALYGSYSVVKNILSISVTVYSRDSDSYKTIETEGRKFGTLIDSLLNDLSARVMPEIKKLAVERTPAPVITVPENPMLYSGTISIKADKPEDEIWYTTDGSEPALKNGYLYSKPIFVRKSTIVKAVASRKGFHVSKVAESGAAVTSSLSYLTFGSTYGNTKVFGTEKKHLKSKTFSYFAAYAQWDIANISAISTVPVLRNFGIIGSYETGKVAPKTDSSSSSTDSKTGFGYIAVYMGFLNYSFRYSDFFSLDVYAGGGKGKGGMLPEDSSNKIKKALFINKISKTEDGINGKAIGGGARINFIWNHVFIHGDAGYRRIKENNGNLTLLFTGAGIGLRL